LKKIKNINPSAQKLVDKLNNDKEKEIKAKEEKKEVCYEH